MILDQSTFGLGRKNINGMATKKKRKAVNKNGGQCSKPALITTKLLPHINTVSKASNLCKVLNLLFYSMCYEML